MKRAGGGGDGGCSRTEFPMMRTILKKDTDEGKKDDRIHLAVSQKKHCHTYVRTSIAICTTISEIDIELISLNNRSKSSIHKGIIFFFFLKAFFDHRIRL